VQNETSPPSISASGRGRCCAPGRVADCVGASPSLVADHNDRAVCCWRAHRRVVAEGMRASLGQPIIIENVTGAGGSIGVGRVARAAPDGYTISIGQWGSHVTNGAIYALPYDLLNDFVPLAWIATGTPLIVSRNTLPAKN
jgi:hypothetical protein